jgi:hypothetical protein
MATYKTLIDGKWVPREPNRRAAAPVERAAPRLVSMGVSDLRIGDYLADKRARVAKRITNIESCDGSIILSFAKGEAVAVTTKTVPVLMH